jgi:hypothetical protein
MIVRYDIDFCPHCQKFCSLEGELVEDNETSWTVSYHCSSCHCFVKTENVVKEVETTEE